MKKFNTINVITKYIVAAIIAVVAATTAVWADVPTVHGMSENFTKCKFHRDTHKDFIIKHKETNLKSTKEMYYKLASISLEESRKPCSAWVQETLNR